MMFWLGFSLLVVGLGSLALTLVTYVCAVSVRRRKQLADPPLPPITVLKPLKGVEPELYENLCSLARQDYPCFEIVLGCDDITDPALAVAHQLRREFPHVAISVVAGGTRIGRNPKVNNLRQLVDAARYDHLLISDADIRVDPHYLRALAAQVADPSVGLVSNVIVGRDERTLGAAFENLHLNTFVTGSVCGADILANQSCVIGKSMFFQRSRFEALGGWNAVKDVLAEDFIMGRLYRGAGLKVVLCPYSISTIVRRRTVRDFMSRHVRWGQMRRRIVPRLYWGEPLLLPSVWLSASLALFVADTEAAMGFERTLATVALSGLVVKVLADGLLVRRVRGEPVRFDHLCLGLVKDWLVVAVWLWAGFKTTVAWRGNVFRIGPDSYLSPLPEAADAMESAQA